jgi:CreA protein
VYDRAAAYVTDANAAAVAKRQPRLASMDPGRRQKNAFLYLRGWLCEYRNRIDILCGDPEMKLLFSLAALIVISVHPALATDLDCVSTTFNLLSPNDKVCVSVFEDPQVPGVVCHISQARKGGWGQPLGLNEDPSNFSISCRQIGPINVDLSKLAGRQEVFSEKTSIFFKTTRIYRVLDKPHNTLVYLAISTKIVNGSPANAISTVPIMPWPH